MNLFNVGVALTADNFCSMAAGAPLASVWTVISFAVKALLIGIPVIMVIFGLMDMSKAVMAGKDDEIKAAQKLLVKRIIYTVVAFLLVTIVSAILGLVNNESSTAIACLDAIF